MKRKLALILTICLLVASAVAVLAACNKGGDNEISFYYYAMTNDLNNELKAKLGKFTEETGIKVKPVSISKDNYNSSVSSKLTSTKKEIDIDVMYLDQPNLAQYAAPGYITKLDDYITESDSREGTVEADNAAGFAFNKSAFNKSAWQTAVYNGSTYAIPLTLNTSVLYYNVETIKKATGLTSDEQAIERVESIKTWNDLKEFAESISGIGTDYALFGGMGNGGYLGWYSQVFVAAAGGTMYDEATKTVLPNDDGTVTKAFDMIKYMFDKSPKAIRNESTGFTGSNASPAGKILFSLADSSSINDLKTRTYTIMRAIPIPSENETIGSVSNIGGENLVIPARSGNKDKALQLVKFLVSGECMPLFEKCTNNFAAVDKYATVKEFADLEDNQTVKATVTHLYTVVQQQLASAQVRPVVAGWMNVNDKSIPTALVKYVDPDKESLDSVDAVLAEIRQSAAGYLK